MLPEFIYVIHLLNSLDKTFKFILQFRCTLFNRRLCNYGVSINVFAKNQNRDQSFLQGCPPVQCIFLSTLFREAVIAPHDPIRLATIGDILALTFLRPLNILQCRRITPIKRFFPWLPW